MLFELDGTKILPKVYLSARQYAAKYKLSAHYIRLLVRCGCFEDAIKTDLGYFIPTDADYITAGEAMLKKAEKETPPPEKPDPYFHFRNKLKPEA